MFDTIFGLPVHPLVVHATVVIVPSAAAAVALAAASKRFRAWAGYLPLLLCAASVLLVPVSTQSGEALEHRLPQNALLEAHTRIAEGLLLPVLVLAVAGAALFWLQRRERAEAADVQDYAPSGGGSTALATAARVAAPPKVVVAVILLVAAVGVVGTTVQVARIGHSGAKAAWSDVVSP